MESECYGEEDASPKNLTQVPIEGILDEFNLFVTDVYEQLNETSETICYQEFVELEKNYDGKRENVSRAALRLWRSRVIDPMA